MGQRIAVVLFNLGGPDSLTAVRPFLFNLFNDQAIIGLPQPLRGVLAWMLARARTKTAVAIYSEMGGGSPLMPETLAQASAMTPVLQELVPGSEVEVFIAMRYWRPLTAETARQVEAFHPDHIVLLPLYPQFSTTTTNSSLEAWRRQYRGGGEIHAVCCYPEESDFIAAHAARIRQVCEGHELGDFRVLFSAHGLPEKVIALGDPYQNQVERTASAVAGRLNLTDYVVCYQSRVGPLKWIRPSTIEALEQAGVDGVPVVVVPIAFVSEHSETLVELDLEYRDLARRAGVPTYLRAPAIGVEPHYINALAEIAAAALERSGVAPQGLSCGRGYSQCPYLKRKAAA